MDILDQIWPAEDSAILFLGHFYMNLVSSIAYLLFVMTRCSSLILFISCFHLETDNSTLKQKTVFQDNNQGKLGILIETGLDIVLWAFSEDRVELRSGTLWDTLPP